MRGARVRHLAETDQSLSLDLHAVAAHEGFLAVDGLHEGAIGALVDEHELVAIDLDARVQSRDQVALDDEVVVFRAPDGDVRVADVNGGPRGRYAVVKGLPAEVRVLHAEPYRRILAPSGQIYVVDRSP